MEQLLLCSLLLLGTACTTLASQQDTHNPLERIKLNSMRHSIDGRIVLSLNSTVLEAGHSHQWFELSWAGVQRPSFADWIGLIVPADADVTKTAPAKYQIAAMDRNHVRVGSGRLRFRLINYRLDMRFGFFRGGMMNPQLAALSPVIKVLNPNEPLQPHLALTGDNTQMLVQWVTKNSANPVVKYGTSPGQYIATIKASSSTYNSSNMCGPPANSVGFVQPGLFHAALIQNLTPGKTYYYTVGDEVWGFSPEAAFSAAPAVGPDVSVKVLAVADVGQGEVDGSMEQSEMMPSLNTTARMLADIQQRGYQLVLHNGDISYARGYVTQWDNFMHQMQPLMSQVPYMTAPGNHERDWPNSGDRYTTAYDSGGECGVALEKRLQMPQAGPDKPWYSFDYGPIHFIQYSTEHAFHKGTQQHSWLLSDLAAVNQTRTPWLIVGGHRPMYISSTFNMPEWGDQPVAKDLREALEDVFLKYRVDLTLHGHHHSYQRTCPVYDNKCLDKAHPGSGSSSSSNVGGSSSINPGRNPGSSSSSSNPGRNPGSSSSSINPGRQHPTQHYHAPPAPIHLVIGHGGAELSPNIDYNAPPIWEVIHLWWGYLRIQATGSRLRCEVVSNKDGSLMDSFVITKSGAWGQQNMQQQWSLGADVPAAS